MLMRCNTPGASYDGRPGLPGPVEVAERDVESMLAAGWESAEPPKKPKKPKKPKTEEVETWPQQ